MSYYAGSLQADLPRFANPEQEWFQQIASVVYGLGLGSVNVTGVNYRIVGGVFSFKNVDTALFNATQSFGADGTQGVVLENGAA